MGLLKRKQCYIYAKGTKMATYATKKNQPKMVMLYRRP
jgi:hypothetical protein